MTIAIFVIAGPLHGNRMQKIVWSQIVILQIWNVAYTSH